MEHNYIATVKDGNDFKEINVNAEIYESGAFEYGNRKGLALSFDGGREHLFDIRYDKRYKGNDDEYIKTFLENDWWTGKNGAWALVHLMEI